MQIVPDMGHAMMLEDGWPVAAEIISQFLSLTRSASERS
jgi:pimeloyl-ACP methyl ester carboxylesterase